MKTELEFGAYTPYMKRNDPAYGATLRRTFIEGLKRTRERRKLEARKEVLRKLQELENLK